MRKKLFGFSVFLFCCPVLLWGLPDIQDPEAWYDRALQDYESASLVRQETTYHGQTCFLAHQAIEKYLKGTLLGMGRKPERTHYNEKLAEKAIRGRPDLKNYKKELRWMDQIYISSRYPKPGIHFSKKDSATCLETAKNILQPVL